MLCKGLLSVVDGSYTVRLNFFLSWSRLTECRSTTANYELFIFKQGEIIKIIKNVLVANTARHGDTESR